MITVFSPGSELLVDEIMSAWRGRCGKDGHHDQVGTPHGSKVLRKPEPIGTMGLEWDGNGVRGGGGFSVAAVWWLIMPCNGQALR